MATSFMEAGLVWLSQLSILLSLKWPNLTLVSDVHWNLEVCKEIEKCGVNYWYFDKSAEFINKKKQRLLQFCLGVVKVRE